MTVAAMREARDRAFLARHVAGNVTAVVGPSCSGKTTHVAEHRGPSDAVLDVDALAVACGSTDPHDHSTLHLALAFAARDAVLARWHREHTAADRLWVIATSRRQLAALGLGDVDVHEMTTPLDECEARALAAGRSPAVVRAIREWDR